MRFQPNPSQKIIFYAISEKRECTGSGISTSSCRASLFWQQMHLYHRQSQRKTEREQVLAERHFYLADPRTATGSIRNRNRSKNSQILLQDMTINVLLSLRLTNFLLVC